MKLENSFKESIVKKHEYSQINKIFTLENDTKRVISKKTFRGSSFVQNSWPFLTGLELL